MLRYGLCVIRAVLLMAVGDWGMAVVSYASQFTPTAVGSQDLSLGGNVVALPLNPSSATFHNPAQLAVLPNSITQGLGVVLLRTRYESSFGYAKTNHEVPLVPNFGYVTNRFAPFHVGIGMSGALGYANKYAADPQRGIPSNFHSELASASLALSVAYSLTPKLHVGVALNPAYGRLRLKSPSLAGRIDVDVRGPGVFGTIGVLYQPTAKLSLGVNYKTPGALFLFGNARVAGRGDDATAEYQFPQSVTFGAAYRVTPQLTVVGQGRWTEFSAFEDSHVDFEQRTFLNQPAASGIRDRFRFGGGVQYEVWPGITARAGISWERSAIRDSAMVPALSDFTDILLPFGLGFVHGPWQVNLLGGVSFVSSRKISPAQNQFFPGRYEFNISAMGIEVTRLLGTSR